MACVAGYVLAVMPTTTIRLLDLSHSSETSLVCPSPSHTLSLFLALARSLSAPPAKDTSALPTQTTFEAPVNGMYSDAMSEGSAAQSDRANRPAVKIRERDRCACVCLAVSLSPLFPRLLSCARSVSVPVLLALFLSWTDLRPSPTTSSARALALALSF